MCGLKSSDLLSGRYELGPVLGEGGMGTVRAAQDLRLGRPVAVKTLRPDLAGRPEVRRRFEAEARAAARLTHFHVVGVYDVGEDDGGVPFIVMERVHGLGLEQEMATGPMDPARACEVGAGILAALGAAHAAGIVHRDVKPANVLVTADGSPKVVDFGIAKALDRGDGATAEVDLTGDGQLVGTVAYMAPERVEGSPATVQSDLYSVGVILYEALAGTRPFKADTPISMCWAVHHGQYAPLGQVRPDLPAALVAVIERAMARRPEDRFTTATDMAASLTSALSVVSLQPEAPTTAVVAPPTGILSRPAPAAPATPAPAPPPAPAPAQRWPVLAAAAVMAVIALFVLGGGRNGDTPRSPAEAQPPAEAGTVPAPLDDALSDLEELLR